MSQNCEYEMLPSYQDVMEERKTESNKSYRHALSVFFLLSDIFISLLTFGGFFVVRFTDTFRPRTGNVTKYCNDTKYYISPIPELNYVLAYAAITMTFVLCFLLLLSKSYIKKYRRKQLIKEMLWKTWILGLYLTFLYIFIEFLKCATGIPRPYFFSVQNLTTFYCDNKHKEKYMSLFLEKLDNELRKSFPSYRSAIYAFCITLMYSYIDHFDTIKGPKAIQQIFITIFGACLVYFQYHSWEQGENHLNDIMVGASIGTIQALITVRSMFGSIFSSRLHKLMCGKKNTANFYTSTPTTEFGEDQSDCNMLPMRQITNRYRSISDCSANNSELDHLSTAGAYESTETVFTDIHYTAEDRKSLLEIQNQEETAVMMSDT